VRLSVSGSTQSRSLRKLFRLSISAKQALFAYAIILPTLAIIVIFRFLPMLQAFYISLHEYDPASHVHLVQ
jgi:ABC-type sugar transport system permease subunit